ncbi:MAG: glycosyltransferase family 10 [Formivibrio sp.]|nr:glycosyltransferase family 10 [Formivibrio sp.]
MRTEIFIDPSYRVFDSNGLFDLDNPILNRDGQLLPYDRFRKCMANKDVGVSTADYLFKHAYKDMQYNKYYSLGILENFERILHESRARLSAFVIMEPPVVAPALYEALPRLTEVFEKVFVYNIRGDGYSLDGVNTSKLHKFYYPIPHADVLSQYWENAQRTKRLVVINGSHNAHGRSCEQYSIRIKAMAELSKIGIVDLYGMGWDKWWSRNAMWLPYWLNYRALMSIYKGKCASKFDVLQRYDFCLCFENMKMDGYITEKLFDCLYAGTIPLYMGAPDVLEYIPADVFVDCRKYSTWIEMWEDVSSMSAEKIHRMRIAGRNFLQNNLAKKFYNSMNDICEG